MTINPEHQRLIDSKVTLTRAGIDDLPIGSTIGYTASTGHELIIRERANDGRWKVVNIDSLNGDTADTHSLLHGWYLVSVPTSETEALADADHDERAEAHQAAWDLITAWTDNEIDSNEALRQAWALTHPTTDEEITFTARVRVDLPTKELDTLLNEYVAPVHGDADHTYVSMLPTSVVLKILLGATLTVPHGQTAVEVWDRFDQSGRVGIAMNALDGVAASEYVVIDAEFGDTVNDIPF